MEEVADGARLGGERPRRAGGARLGRRGGREVADGVRLGGEVATASRLAVAAGERERRGRAGRGGRATRASIWRSLREPGDLGETGCRPYFGGSIGGCRCSSPVG